MFEPKPKEDEPMDTGEITSEGNNEEEGEILSDDGEVFWTEGKTIATNILRDATSYGLPPSSIQELKKLSRAKRFGIPIEPGTTALVNTTLMTRLYKSLGINEENEKNYRFNAIHMRGTENMSSTDVYEYFKTFNPTYIEWINDLCCNIVWTDHFSAAKALLSLSKEIKNLDKICFDTNPFKKEYEWNTMVFNKDADAVDAREIEGAIPPGHWRFGVPSSKSRTILMRLATRRDKKQGFAEKNSEYYKKYGNPHFGNMPGIVSNSLRNEVFGQNRQRSGNYGGNLQDKNKKNPWGSIAEEWGKQDEYLRLASTANYETEIRDQGDLRLILTSKHVYLPPKKSKESHFEASRYEKDKFPEMTMYADEEVKLRISFVETKKKVPQENVSHVEDLRQRINRSRKRRQLMHEEMKNKRIKFWTEGIRKEGSDIEEEEDESDDDRGRVETDTNMEGVKEEEAEVDFDNDNNPDNDKGNGKDADVDIDVDDDDDDDEEKGSSWALENYSDLRDSVTPGKKFNEKSDAKKPEKSKSNAEDKGGDDDYDEEDEICNMDVNHRSPLQIEFENDDYFENESN